MRKDGVIRGATVAELYRALIHRVTRDPDCIVSPRGELTMEAWDVTVEHTDPGHDSGCFQSPTRSTDHTYLSEELAWYLSGGHYAEEISHAAKLWDRIKNDDGTLNSAYGHTIFYPWLPGLNGSSQWHRCVDALTRDPVTRQAVLTFHSAAWFGADSSDVPCTLHAVFRLRPNDEGAWHLDLITSMRSQDLWYGFTYDAPWFMLLQRLMVEELNARPIIPEVFGHGGVVPGVWRHNVVSMHAYDRNVDALTRMLAGVIKPAPFPLHDVKCLAVQDHPRPLMRGALIDLVMSTQTWHKVRGGP